MSILIKPSFLEIFLFLSFSSSSTSQRRKARSSHQPTSKKSSKNISSSLNNQYNCCIRSCNKKTQKGRGIGCFSLQSKSAKKNIVCKPSSLGLNPPHRYSGIEV